MVMRIKSIFPSTNMADNKTIKAHASCDHDRVLLVMIASVSNPLTCAKNYSGANVMPNYNVHCLK